MVVVSHGERIVFPDVNHTKADVVAYYERLAPRILEHVRGRPLSIRRYPQGLSGPGFFQKNVPAHYPASFRRLAVPRSRAATKKHAGAGRDVTVYPLLSEAEQLAYLANQGAIELHVPTVQGSDLWHPDRLVVDLDPPAGALAEVRRAALVTREALARHGLETAPVATGSKGYHVVAALQPLADVETLALALHQLATLLAAEYPDLLTTTFRIAERGGRVFVDWLRLGVGGSVVAPYSLRATAMASVATPLAWDEVETTPPNGWTLNDAERLLERPDPLAKLVRAPGDPRAFAQSVAAAFEASGLVLKPFDRFRS
jgi:bifunctional non-homologous end joining protein LigD